MSRAPAWIWNDAAAAQGAGDFAAALHDYATLSFLYHMFIIFVVLFVMMGVVAALRPMPEPRTLPTSDVDVQPWKLQYVAGGAIIAVTVALYVIFR